MRILGLIVHIGAKLRYSSRLILIYMLSMAFKGCMEYKETGEIKNESFIVESYNLITPKLVWTMVNVNMALQGDAHLIRMEIGKTVLIDTGSLLSAEVELIPFLRNNEIDEIDIVFISHPHRDHYGGIIPIINAGIHIKEIYFNIPDKDVCDREIPWGCNYKEVILYHQLINQYKINIKVAEAGQLFDLGNNAILRILYAFDGINTPVGRTDVNDLSLIMILEYSGYKMLFTGDLNTKIGNYLAKYGEGIQANVLKVPHHGTESVAPNNFFDKVNPQYALVPAPKNLWESERSKRVREYFQEKNIPVFVTGISGNVIVEIENEIMNISTEYD